MKTSGITSVPILDLAEHEQLVNMVKRFPFHWWKDAIDALPGRIDKARELAAKSLEPQAQTVDIPKRTLKTQEDIRLWVIEVEKTLKEALSRGPVIIC